MLYAALKVAVRRKENKDLLPELRELQKLMKAGGTRAGARPRRPKKGKKAAPETTPPATPPAK